MFDSHFLGLINLNKNPIKEKTWEFIQIGSSAEYGKNHLKLKIQNVYQNTPYALAKFSCTNFLQNFYQIGGFPFTILRFFLVYGQIKTKLKFTTGNRKLFKK